jgi:hypothetical protein
MALHTVGDSHSYAGWPSETITHYLGAPLCYTFGKEVLNKCDIRDFDLKEGDTLVFCFGEIDCRCHVHKHINEHTTYESIIDEIIDSYINAVNVNLITVQTKIKVCLYNVIPPIRKLDMEENPEFPFLGTDEERKKYILYFNKTLKTRCEENGFIFFDIYDNYLDDEGFLRRDMGDGNVHIADGIHLSNFIRDIK